MALAHAMSPLDAEPTPRARELTAFLGMLVFLAGWTIMFAALFFAYAGVRLQATSWPPPGQPRLPLAWPAVNTVILVASSLTMHRALTTIRNWRVVDLPRWILATLILGGAFLALQLRVWMSVAAGGLNWSTNIYGSVFYGLTFVHAIHVVAGLIALAAIGIQARRGRYRKNRHTAVRMVAMFWHFVDVVWLVMFFAVYVF